MKGLKTYFTYLHRNKLFTLVNVAGLGISLMFVLLIANMVVRQLTVGSDIKDIEHIYVLSNEEYSASNYLVGERLANRYPEMADWCAVNAEACNSGSYAVIDNRKTSLEIYCVKDNFLRFFGYSLLSGNPEQALVDAHSIVLTESAARKLFGEEPAEGKMLRLSGDKKEMYTVTGVIKDFDNSVIPDEVEAIVPFDYVDFVNWGSSMRNPDMNNMGGTTILVRFPQGVNPDQKAADMLSFLKTFSWGYQHGLFREAFWMPLKDVCFSEIMSPQLRQYNPVKVWIFLVAGILILLMAIFNYVSMCVAQVSYRAKEMATRRLLGSSARSIFWRLLGESALFTTGAFLLALLLAKAVEPTACDLLQTRLDIWGDLNGLTLLIYLIGIILLSLLAGVVPAVLLSHYHPLDVVKGTFRRKTKAVYLRALYVVQSGLTVAMLTCTLYLSAQIYRILREPLGYTYGHVLDYPAMTVGSSEKIRLFRDEARKKPFVKNVCLTAGTPVNRGNNNTTQLYDNNGIPQNVSFQVFRTDSAFLDIFHIQVFDDRKLPRKWGNMYFSESTFDSLQLDYARTAELRNEYGRQYAVGGRYADIKFGSILLPQSPTMISVEHPDKVRPWNVLVETIEGDQAAYKRELDALFSEVVEGIPFESKWYADEMKEVYKDLLHMRTTIVAFTCAALLISLLGLTAMSIYFISQRKRDMAIRKVFGSSARMERARLLRFSLLSLLAGMLLAVPLAWFGVQQIDGILHYSPMAMWGVFGVAFLLVALISLGSVCLISWGAVRENPVNHIKTE